MKSICFISTYLNHHNKPICDALYKFSGPSFHYVATSNIGELRKSMGFTQMDADYLLDYTNHEKRKGIQGIIDSADVVLIGASEPIYLIRNRLKHGKLTFRCSERLFKTTSRYLKAPVHWCRCLLSRKAHLLCIGALSARDYNLLGFYKRRCFRWGYFTEVKNQDPERLWDYKIQSRVKENTVSILWVGRLIGWKQPEAIVKALKIVREVGFSFDLTMIGDGPVAPLLRTMIEAYNMNDCIHLLGARSTSTVRQYMEKSEIFVFTSNRQEGWGAVLNEAMSCACSVIANSEIGSVPFLLKNGFNGLIYYNNSIERLSGCILQLIESESYKRQLGIEAYNTISDCWSPRNAATNLIALVDSIQHNNANPIKDGPCSLCE